MAIRVALHHQTAYRFDRPVGVSPHVIRLRPAPHARTPIHAYSLKIEPAGKYFINWMQDPFGNFQARLVFPEKVRELGITVDLVAEMTVINPFDFFVESYAEKYPFTYEPTLFRELTPYLEIQESGPLLNEWLNGVDRTPKTIVDFLVDLNQRLSQDIGYIIRMEPGVQTCEETLGKRSGSCRDTGWLLVQILRHLGLAARFVSGYLIQLTADVKALDGPSGTEVDFTDLHAWAEVFVPGAGWIGLDPTSGLFAGEGHIPLACTPTPPSAAPVTGYTDKCETEFGFDMKVTRIHEDPRVTKPYTEEQWQAIETLGYLVDKQLHTDDVRLTMGGEPTFVSIDDMDGAEWTTAAIGPTKRKLAGRLLKKLRDRFAPYGFLHYSQGKWYPGESLPRWALSCYWRSDDLPLWHDPRWIADDETPQGYGPDQARAFIAELTRRLGVETNHIIPGYEDVYYYLWKERTLPVNVDPLKYDLKDDEERRRLAILLERGLNTITGYALPIRWHYAPDGERWMSGPWALRREHLYLIPGDSPMGYRLPLAALPWVGETDREVPHPQSLFEFRTALGDTHGEVMRRYSAFLQGRGAAPRGDFQEQPTAEADTSPVIHTALCVEPREGHIYIFMPPLGQLEHYLDLLACVEQTAADLEMPVLVEGYAPPSDWRLRKFAVTPDPGVIEVNIHPARDWNELKHNVEGLYEDARQSRLGTEKFMLDGRHTGTGGGNHVTLGGATPSDSPFLRRPEVLRSLITYWQH
ncbi:MAG: transglutaminase family protein, partial [Candidatus Competibacteraceae bacterium]|nr:transglutaminase family protein [Candidatus Competibacteraceae bacterium]